MAERRQRVLTRCVRAAEMPRTLTFIASTEAVARDGDIILATAWEDGLDQFRLNPVILWAHTYGMPIGRSIEERIILDGEPRLEIDVEFAGENVNPLAPQVYEAYQSGFLHAVSVGFMVKSFDTPDDERREELELGPSGIIITQAELLEVSAVPVPADPAALISQGMRVPEEMREILARMRGSIGPSDREELDHLLRGVEGQTSLDDLMREVRGLRGDLRGVRRARATRPSKQSRSVCRAGSEGGALYDDLCGDIIIIDDME